MSKRFFEIALAVVAAIVFLAPAPAAAQTPSTAAVTKQAAKTWTPPRTPDGKPDISGIFSNASVVPLERRPDALDSSVVPPLVRQARECRCARSVALASKKEGSRTGDRAYAGGLLAGHGAATGATGVRCAG